MELDYRMCNENMLCDSFSNDICASFFTDPDLVDLVCIDIPSTANAESLLRSIWVIRICVRQRAVEDEMCRHTGVFVWRIVGIALACQDAVKSKQSILTVRLSK